MSKEGNMEELVERIMDALMKTEAQEMIAGEWGDGKATREAWRKDAELIAAQFSDVQEREAGQSDVAVPEKVEDARELIDEAMADLCRRNNLTAPAFLAAFRATEEQS
jgi:hypothetical protein